MFNFAVRGFGGGGGGSGSSSYSDSFSFSSSSNSIDNNKGSMVIAIIGAVAAPIAYAINGVLDKTVISVRVRHELSYIATVGCMDAFLG